MNRPNSTEKRFLFLQGPHGPFFDQLARSLRQDGHQTWRVGFNCGDQVFWSDKKSYIPFTKSVEEWPERLDALLVDLKITDVVIYGDIRPHHAAARKAVDEHGLRMHVFEEGYLRPYWVTYERDGANGLSPLMRISVQEMERQLGQASHRPPPAPAHWGDMREHMFYGALYHFFVLTLNRSYRRFRPHRGISVAQEFRLYLRRLLLMPVHAAHRMASTRAALRGGHPYHLVLLQLEHDANFLSHSPFASGTEFLEVCMRGFAKGAPGHHRLVFKAHPLEDGRSQQRVRIRELARKYNISDRVFYIRGGKLARLLSTALSAITVNSTAAQQVLWRGLPLKAFGEAVYSKPEFVSPQSIECFFSDPQAPDLSAYHLYRHYLLETSQFPGGFYSRKGRETLLRQATDLLLEENDRYTTLANGESAQQQHLTLVS